VLVPFDMDADSNNSEQTPNFLNGAIPLVGDTYQFQVTFSDGTTQNMSASVTALLSSFAQNLAMNTSSPHSGIVPLLTWAAPSSPPPFYTYTVGLNNAKGAQENWYYSGGNNSNGIPSTQTSVVFDVDGSAFPSSSLTSGMTYDWWVTVRDANGNSAQFSTTYLVPVSSAQVPHVNHVFIVLEENTNFSDVIGNPAMPYLNSLASRFGLATNYFANTHPSIGNYFMLTAGQIITNDDSFSSTVSVDNIVRQLLAQGKTWKAYEEDLPSPGYIAPDVAGYARKHAPLSFFSDVVNSPTEINNLVPFTQFAQDLAGNRFPNYSFISPNLCNDAHDCALSTADTWLRNNIDPLVTSPLFQSDGILVIVFDESGSDNTNGGGKVAWVVVSPKAKTGFQSTNLYQHQSTLRMMAEALGLTSFPGAATTAPDMAEFFGNPAPPNGSDFGLSATPASQSVTQGGSASYTLSISPSGGFTGSVSLGASGLPSGATASFSPSAATTSSTMTVSTTAATPTGSFPVTITGTSTGAGGTLTQTASVTLVVR
jgi:hypothetical protein